MPAVGFMVDLPTTQIVFFNRDIPEAENFGQLAVTKDGRHILQRNSNDHLYIYDVAKEKLVLRGFDIDDEIIIYDQRGYFVAPRKVLSSFFLNFQAFPAIVLFTSLLEL